MNNKRVVRVIAIILALVMLLSIFFILLDALAPPALANTQARINSLRDEKNDINRRMREIQSRINDIEFERAAHVVQKQVLDDRIILTGLEIDNINQVIGLYEQLIIEKELEVVAAQNRQRDQLEIYRSRVRNMEENGIISYLEILFDSTSFSDLLARWEFIGDILRADEQLFSNLEAARAETDMARDLLSIARDELEQEKGQLELREFELEEQLAQASALIVEIMRTLDTEQVLYDQIRDEAENVQIEINRRVEEQRRDEERRRAANRVEGTGALMWPTPGPIINTFGVTRHADFGVQRMHFGIDIGARHGANVVASDTGVVIISAFNSSYGNFIVINHGNGFTTLYAHLSARLVNVGTTVGRGQVIGRVGSTGISTGPHLHFEVSENGYRVNPSRFVS